MVILHLRIGSIGIEEERGWDLRRLNLSLILKNLQILVLEFMLKALCHYTYLDLHCLNFFFLADEYPNQNMIIQRLIKCMKT